MTPTIDEVYARDSQTTALPTPQSRSRGLFENLELVEQFVGGDGTFSDDLVDKDMVLWAVQRRSVVVKDITYYVYCRNMASWWQMESATAFRELSKVPGINAPTAHMTTSLSTEAGSAAGKSSKNQGPDVAAMTV
ncbi:hypothetical protein E4U17_005258 [Claviceps sp. LM77 group G4]|nr:hypothetical protein E4U17_005258 [Claviceps sp. LM77 group G4]